MTADEVIESYWKYYLSLETQVVELERYVEFDLKINGKAYSARFLELLQTICSEVDVVGKVLALHCDPGFVPTRNTTIKNWWFVIQNTITNIQNDPITFRKKDLYPWKNFFVIRSGSKHVNDTSVKNSNVPSWWNSYNKVKHRRTEKDGEGLVYYTHANLSNVINALAGLFLLETLLLERTGCVVDRNQLFTINGHHVFRNYMTWGAE